MKRSQWACLAAGLTLMSGAPGGVQAENLQQDRSAKQAAADRLAGSRKNADPAAAQVRRAQELERQALALENDGRPQESEPLYREAHQIYLAALGERHADSIRSLNDYGYILSVIGRTAEAEQVFARVVDLSRAEYGERDDYTMLALANRGRSLLELGRADEAEGVLSQSLQLYRETKGDNDPGTMQVLGFYASTLEALSRHVEAEPLHAEVLRNLRKTRGARHPETIAAQGNYALVLMNLGRAEEAEPILAQAVQAAREVLGERQLYTVTLIGNHGVLLETLGRTGEAEARYREGLQLQRELLGPQHPLTMASLNNVGNALKNLGRYEEAQVLMAESVQLHERVLGPNHPRTIAARGNLAKVLVINRQWPEALANARALAGIMRSRADDLSGSGVRASAQRDRELGERQGFEKFLANVLWGNRMRTDIDVTQLPFEAFTSLQLASAGSTSRAVREAAAARFASGLGLAELVQERQQRVREWQATEEALVASEAGGSATADMRTALRAQLAAVEARITQLEAQLEKEAPQYFAILSQQAVDLAALRAVLGEDEAVLFLVPTPYGVHSMAIDGERIEWAAAPIDETELGAIVRDFRAGLEVGQDTDYLPLFDLEQSYELYRQLIAPVEAGLTGKKRVYVVADGALSRLPLGTLTASPPSGETVTDDPETLRGADWLADRYALVQLPSLQSLVYIRAFSGDAQGSDGFAGFGAPVLGGEATTRGARSATLAPIDAANLVSGLRGSMGMPLMNPAALRTLSSLPGTRGELEQVRSALGAPERSLHLAEEMTETAIREADLSDVAILHLATHGFTSEEAGGEEGGAAEPGLVFTPPTEPSARNDGYLAASEVVGLNLAAARWVILSACNTAAPSGNAGETGLSGLAQAFFYAGAQSLLVSHWPVFDDIAPVLTVEALKRSQGGMPRAEALQAAMREVRDNPQMNAAHPAVWAPFTLVGEGR